MENSLLFILAVAAGLLPVTPPSCQAQEVVLNEIMAANTRMLRDADGDWSGREFFRLANP